jgi:CarboxypepD_reg-like domain
MMNKLTAVLILLLTVTETFSQNVISGIVVDSISLTSLPKVTIKIKNSPRETATTSTGSFIIMAADFDTLLFSRVGFETLSYPLLGPEEDILIRLKSKIVLLKEVSVTAKQLDEIMEKKPPRYTKSDGSYIKTMSVADGIGSPFTYFSSWEREKRKLLKMREQNRKVKTYVDVVNDPLIKADLMKKFSLTESDYYEILATFNQQNRQAAYMNDVEEIKKLLFAYYQKILRQ